MFKTLKSLLYISILTHIAIASAEETTALLTPLMQERAAALQKIIRSTPEHRSGVYMYERTFSVYADRMEELAARCRALGLTDIYYSFSEKHASDPKIKDRTTKQVELFHRYGLNVHALRFEEIDSFFTDSSAINSACGILNYNKSVHAEARFDAATADLEPQILKKGRSYVPDNAPVYWDSKVNVQGGSNDILLKRTIAVLGMIKHELNGLPLSEAIGHFFESRYQKKELSCGGINDFLQVCDFAIIMAYSNKPEQIITMSEKQLQTAKRPRSVAVCVKTSTGTFNDEGAATSLQPGGWDKMIETLIKVTSNAEKYQAFRGIDFFEYAGLEKMWENH